VAKKTATKNQLQNCRVLAALCFSMNSKYRGIIKKERRNQILIVGLMLGPFILSVLVLVLSGNFTFSILFLVCILVASYRFYVYVRPRLAIECPLCKLGVLSENYANCRPKTDHNVEHKCDKCGAFFINAILQSKT
jgi:hypothetical protein